MTDGTFYGSLFTILYVTAVIALILVEKVLGSSAKINNILVKEILRNKKRAYGYSGSELITNKRKSYEGFSCAIDYVGLTNTLAIRVRI